MNTEQKWNKKAESLIGRKIVGARYMTKEEAEEWGFYSQPIVLLLDDRNFIFPSRDDEGNDAGALFSSKEEYEFPVI